MRTRSEAKRPIDIKRNSSNRGLSRKQTQKSDTLTDEEQSPPKQQEPRIITPIRTPKLKSPKRKNLGQTPGRDDLLCSQHFDSQVVVGWDCNSPDTLRGIKRISGTDQHDDVSDLVLRLIGEDNDNDTFTKRSTPPLLGVWREEQEDKLLDDKTNISHRLRRTKARQRKRSGKDSAVSKDLLNKLSIALDKHNEEDEVTDHRDDAADIFLPGNEATKLHNLSDDLFNSENNNNVELRLPRTSPRLLEKKNSLVENKGSGQNTDSIETQKSNAIKSAKNLQPFDNFDEKTKTGQEEIDESWSDDELFEEDSFIIKATQVSCDTKQFVSPVFGVKRKTSGDSALPKSKCTRYTFQLGDDENEKGYGNGKFTCLQNKQEDNSLNSRYVKNNSKLETSGNFNARSNFRGTSVTASSKDISHSNNRPPVYPRSTSNNLNTGRSSQAFTGSSDQGLVKSTKDTNIPVTRQRGSLVSNSYTASSANKPSTSQSSSAFTSVSFKKHSSFSGTNSLNLVSDTSRRRSISGDSSQYSNRQGSSVLKSAVNASSSNAVSTNTCKMYPPDASRISVLNSSSKSVLSSSHCSNKSGVTVIASSSSVSSSSSVVRSSSSRKPASSTSLCDSASKVQHGAGNKGQYTTSATVNVDRGKILPKSYSSSAKLTDKETSVLTEGNRSSIGGLDTSLSDDLLCQLAEPDDILDSQAVLNVTVTPVTHIPSTSSNVLPRPVIAKPTSNALPSTNSCYDSSVTNGTINKIASTSTLMENTKNKVCNNVSDNQMMKKQFKFKPSQRKPASPPINKQQAGNEKADRATDKISSSTKDIAVEQYSEDLFADDDGDDMFLADDDGLTEPQILAMLDEAELLATQQHSAAKSNQISDSVSKGQSSETKGMQVCQSQSFEKYRTSDHGSDLLGSQGHLAGSQGQTTGSQGQLFGSQGQPAGSQCHNSSQTKYSPEEIERKKLEAIERRKRKLKKV